MDNTSAMSTTTGEPVQTDTTMVTVISGFLERVTSSPPGDNQTLASALGTFTELDDETVTSLASTPEFIEVLKTSLASADSGLAAASARIVAELAKTEGNRELLRNNGVVPLVCDALRSTAAKQVDTKVEVEVEVEVEAALQCLRAVGNLCADDDENRDLVFTSDGTLEAIAGLIDTNNMTIRRTACGALTNLCMDGEPIQNKLLTVKPLPSLLAYLDVTASSPGDVPFDVLYVVVRLVAAVIASEVGIQQILSGDGLNVLIGVLRHRYTDLMGPVSEDSFDEDLQVLEPLVAAIEGILENESIQRKTLEDGHVDILFDLVDKKPTHEMDEEQRELYEDIRRTCTRIVSLVTMHDVNMVDICKKPEIVNRFFDWATTGYGTDEVAQEDKVRVAGCLCLGNLARSDETCTLLVRERHADETMVEVIRQEEKRIDPKVPEMRGVIKVLHAATGALKNMSLAPENKAHLGTTDMIEVLTSILPFPGLRPIQYNVIGIFKNITSSKDYQYNIHRIVTGTKPTTSPLDLASENPSYNKASPLADVVKLLSTSTDESEAGVRNEGARLIANLIKFLHSLKLEKYLRIVLRLDAIPSLIQVITGFLVARDAEAASTKSIVDASTDTLNEAPHVHFSVGSVEGPVYPIVQMDGILALVLVFDSAPDYISQIMVFKKELVASLDKIIDYQPAEKGNVEYNEHIKSNAKILLSKIVAAST